LSPTRLAFIGDVHQQWHYVERGLVALEVLPEAVILLGDLQCERPLDELAAPLLDRGIAVFWIAGNHDNDGGAEMWANLTDAARNPRTAPGALHGRVAEIAGWRVAGLTGTFRPRVWQPPAPSRLRGRAELAANLAALGPSWRPEHVAALGHSLGSLAIWPEDVAALAEQTADILVVHDAPSSHPEGFAALDGLARAMGARLIVHGHHHVTYRAMAQDGLSVLGVGSACGAGIAGEILWPGDEERSLGRIPQGWLLKPPA
jgi:predicted phosphodiesterase